MEESWPAYGTSRRWAWPKAFETRVEKIGFEVNLKHTVCYRPEAYHGPGWSRHAWTCASLKE